MTRAIDSCVGKEYCHFNNISMKTIKLTELTVRELENVKGGINDQDSLSEAGKCLCNGHDVDACAAKADA